MCVPELRSGNFVCIAMCSLGESVGQGSLCNVGWADDLESATLWQVTLPCYVLRALLRLEHGHVNCV